MTAKSDVTTPPWVDPDDAPELTEAQLATADLYEGDKFIRRVGGRPKGSGTKELVSLRIDRDILDRFRDGGPGWQTDGKPVLTTPYARRLNSIVAPRAATGVARNCLT